MARAGECDRCVDGYIEIVGIHGDGRPWYGLGACTCRAGLEARTWILKWQERHESRARRPSSWPLPRSPSTPGADMTVTQVLLFVSAALFAVGSIVAFTKNDLVFGFALAGAAVWVLVQAIAASP